MMTLTENNSTTNPVFVELLQKYNNPKARPSIASLFADDSERFARFSCGFQGLLLDFSKTSMTGTALRDLLELVKRSALDEARAALFAGEKVNSTEGRPALHPWLRSVVPANNEAARRIDDERRQMLSWAETLRAGRMPGSSLRISDVVHIGIGGSALGPQLVADAVDGIQPGVPDIHFLASADGHGLTRLLKRLRPGETAFIIASKSFSTRETMQNAKTVRAWLSQTPGVEPSAHFLAITANTRRAIEFGMEPERILAFPEGIGGRFSLWSAIGLPAAVAVGADNFSRLLDGAASMDEHFRAAPPEKNLAVLLALTAVWHRNVCNYPSVAVMPYDIRLRFLPDWLQQLDMESCGKGVDRNGRRLGLDTAPVILGGVGTESQHAVFQALHQGTSTIPVEFIGVLRADHEFAEHHRIQLAHMLAQSEALALGRSTRETADMLAAEGLSAERIDALAPHRTFPGNRPSVSLLIDRLTPFALGQLLALYEHKIFVQSVLWNINAFDQWGVEFGKTLASGYESLLTAAGPDSAGAACGAAGLAGYVCEKLAAPETPHS